MSAWQRAGSCLRANRRGVRILAAAELSLSTMLLLTGWILQRMMQDRHLLGSAGTGRICGWDLWLSGFLLAALLTLTPIRVQSAWILGEMTGVLDDNDTGFLRCSRNTSLWGKMLAARLLIAAGLLLSLLPTAAAWTAAGIIWRLMPLWHDAYPALLAAAHLLLAGAGLLMLPLRVLRAWLALPLCFLKTPHRSAGDIVRNALLLSRHAGGRLLLCRGILLPLMLVPPAAALFLPRLAASELLWANRRWSRCCGGQQMRLKHRKKRHFLSCSPHKTPDAIPADRCAIR